MSGVIWKLQKLKNAGMMSEIKVIKYGGLQNGHKKNFVRNS